MSTREHLPAVVAALQPVVQRVSDAQLDDPTPCSDWDVRGVANHLLGTVEAMRRVGADEPMDPEDPWGTGSDHMSTEWRTDLSDLLTRHAEAWSPAEAWQGDAMGGAMPRQVVGDMGFVEVVLHGWDLAAGSGQQLVLDDDAVQQALEVMNQIGEMGRKQGAFGTLVELPDDAPAFDRVLAQSGRDPRWTP